MRTLITLFFVLFSIIGFSQTMTNTGNWDAASNWASSNIADNIAENATINSTISATVRNSYNYVVGNVNLVQDNTLSVNNGGNLTLGASGTPKSLTTGMNAKLVIKGELIIWGDLIANSNITIDLSGGGKLVIHGKLKMNGNTTITSSGGSIIEVYGDYEGTNNNNVTLNGSGTTVLVHGNVNVASGSNLNPGSGSFQYGGTCNDAGSNFCSHATFNGALPIELLSFKGYVENGKPKLVWTTASELNNDYFSIFRYENGETFEVGRVRGAGTTHDLNKYEWVDESINLTGKLYYRLAQTDFNGTRELFKMIVVDMNTKLVAGFVIGDDEQVIATQYLDELGRETNTQYGLRIVRLTTTRGIYTRKEYITSNF